MIPIIFARNEGAISRWLTDLTYGDPIAIGHLVLLMGFFAFACVVEVLVKTLKKRRRSVRS